MRIIVQRQQFEDPGFVKQIFGNPVFGFGWFFLRLYLGLQWLQAGWHKVSPFSDDSIGWVRDGTVTVVRNGQQQEVFYNAGDRLLGFWKTAVGATGQPPRITFEWYRDFIQFMIDHRWNGWFTYLIAYGEFLVGIALIVGAFTGIAAFAGAVMNLNFMLAGTASTNPVLFTVAIFIILAWKTAGYVGVDRWLLPLLGTPWQAGQIFQHAGTRPAVRPKAMGAGA
jgi:thiosulfate dehydrogenase [quinone] large subunit